MFPLIVTLVRIVVEELPQKIPPPLVPLFPLMTHLVILPGQEFRKRPPPSALVVELSLMVVPVIVKVVTEEARMPPPLLAELPVIMQLVMVVEAAADA